MCNEYMLTHLAPDHRIARLSMITNLEIESGLWRIPGATQAGDDCTGFDPVTDFFKQALIVTVKRHIAISVVQNQE